MHYKKSEGYTESERYLLELGEKSFLNLWCWPNVYYKPGKELCDLLVVCGDHVLIFSDKQVNWASDKPAEVAWKRWYKKAVHKSSAQIRGAVRWIQDNPDQLFLDPQCTQRVPINIPRRENQKIHGIAVALGTEDACMDLSDGEMRSFMISPDMTGKNEDSIPFMITDVNPDSFYIHIVNKNILDILMIELDTIIDFYEYLDKKASFIRSGGLAFCAGEEALLHYYLTNVDSENKHGFPKPDESEWEENESMILDSGGYEQFLSNPQYLAKKAEDKVSYVWDELIELFTKSMLEGTIITPGEIEFTIADYEIGVRIMAQETRVQRRLLGKMIMDFLHDAPLDKRDTRVLVSPEDKGSGYVILTLPSNLEEFTSDYDKYRFWRQVILKTFCQAVLERFRHISSVIGIAMDTPPKDGSKKQMFSEDMIYIEQVEWAPEELTYLEEGKKLMGIFQGAESPQKIASIQEYPDTKV